MGWGIWNRDRRWRLQKWPCLRLVAEGAWARPLLGLPGFPCPIRYSHDPEIVSRGLQGGISKNVTAPYNLEIVEPGVRQFFG